MSVDRHKYSKETIEMRDRDNDPGPLGTRDGITRQISEMTKKAYVGSNPLDINLLTEKVEKEKKRKGANQRSG